MELQDIIKDVKSKLSEKRFNHSLGVMERAEVLAKIYGEDIEKTKKVAIVHDIAKEMSEEEMIRYTKEKNIQISDTELANPSLLHGKIGADIAKKEYGFDEKMKNAIIYHTTGHQDMDMFAKIIYVADKTENTRKNYKNVEFEQKLSEENIDKAIIYLIDDLLKKCIEKEQIIDINSILLRNKLMLKK